MAQQTLPAWRSRLATNCLIVLVVALALYTRTAAPTITSRFGGVDGGELAATAISGGVAHPSGYPTYLLLARAALQLPWGEPAERLALLSALSAALAAAATTGLVFFALIPPLPHRFTSTVVAVFTGFALILSQRFWSQAIIVEVYALALFWLVVCVWLSIVWLVTGRSWPLVAGAFCLGVGLGSHLTLAALIPALGIAWLVTPQHPQLSPRLARNAALALAAGLLVYACLPLWAARNVMPSWGDLGTWSGLWTHISGAEYRYLVGIVPFSQRIARLGFAARDLLAQPGPLGVVLAIGWGLPGGWRTHRSLVALTGTLAGTSLIFAASYGAADSTVYLLPWTWSWYIWAGLGLHEFVQQSGGSPARHRIVVGGATAALVGALLWSFPANYRQLDLHADTSERDWITQQLNRVPPNAIILSYEDRLTFGVWYAQTALGVRGDVAVIDMRLRARPWYQAQISQAIHVPTGTSICTILGRTARPIVALDNRQALVLARPACP